jgi:hypothetical protein
VIEHRQRLVENLLQSRHGGASGLGAGGALGIDRGLLFRCDRHEAQLCGDG